MDENKISIRDLMDRTGSNYSHTAIWNWATKGHIPSESGTVRDLADALGIPRTKLLDLADYKTSPEDIAWDQEHYPEQVKRPPQSFVSKNPSEDLKNAGYDTIPVASIPRASASLPMSPPQHRDGEEFSWAEGMEGIFCVFAEGDSMHPYYNDGDLIFARKLTESAQPGGKYIVLIDGELTCKILDSVFTDQGEEFVRFRAANSKYPPITVATSRAHIQGIPISKISREDLVAAAMAVDSGDSG